MQESQYVPDAPTVEHPRCKKCGVPMWLTHLASHGPDQEKRTFECKACGATVTEAVKYK